MFLESVNSERDINLYINSPGGDVVGLFAIYDTMQFVSNDVSTICFGQAASAAAVLLAAGSYFKRVSPPTMCGETPSVISFSPPLRRSTTG